MAIDAVRNVKSAVFAGFLAEPDMTLERSALDLREVLKDVALPLVHPDNEAFLNRLRARGDGDRIDRRSIASGVDMRSLSSAPRFSEVFGSSTFRFRQTVVGIDLFNAGGEFGIEANPRNVAIEVFRVDGSDASQFVDLMALLFERTSARFVFGGASFYAENYVQLRRNGFVEGVDDLLWPLTARAQPNQQSANVFRSIASGRGCVLQVFEDLWNGYEDRYLNAAKEFSLRSFWELNKSLRKR